MVASRVLFNAYGISDNDEATIVHSRTSKLGHRVSSIGQLSTARDAALMSFLTQRRAIR